LLNKVGYSIYSILYYLSGFLFPILILSYSLNNFTNYNFDNHLFNNKYLKYISYLVFSILISLSTLLTKYTINIYYFLNNNIKSVGRINIKIELSIILIISILLLLNNSKILLKKFFLIQFFIFNIIIWTICASKFIFNYPIKIDVGNINILFGTNNLFCYNVIYLFLIEIFYYSWSYVSYKNNLSDWKIPIPSKSDFSPIVKIMIFYLGVFIYYSNLNIII